MGDRKVLKAMQQDLNKARAHCYFEKVLDISFEMGEILFNEEKFDDALKNFEEIISLCTDRELESESQKETYLDGLRRSIDCLIELDYLNDASYRAEKYLALSKEFKVLPHIQQAYLNQARAFMYLAEGESLTVSERKNYLTMAEKMFLGSEKSLHDIKRSSKENTSDLEIPKKKASLFQNMTHFFCSTDQLDTAFHYLNLGIELARQSRDLQDVLLLLYCDAQTLYEKKKEYNLCLEYAKKYLNIIEKNKDNIEEKFNCYYHMARYHSMNNNIDEAYFQIKLAKKMKNALKFELSEDAFQLGRRLKFCRVLRNKLDEELENDEDMTRLEQLGDFYCQVQAFKLSNECYSTVLKNSEKNQSLEAEKIYDIKLSVCLNLCDSNQFSPAVEKYLELLKFLRSNVEIEGKDDKMSRIARHLCKCFYNLADKSNSELYMNKANEYAASEASTAKCSNLASQIREQEIGYLSADSDYAENDEQPLEFTEGINSSSSDSESEKRQKVPLSKQKRNAKGETKLQVAVIEGKLSVVRSLINQGYSVNVRDNNGWTPLHEAANHGHVEICKLLIENGAKVDMVMAQTGLTPLMDAIQSHQFECAKVLLENGAYPYFPGKIGICAADSFYQLLDKEYGENNTTGEEWEVFEQIKNLMDKIARPKSVVEAKTVNTKVLDAHLLSNTEAQCPEIVSGGSSDEADDVYVPPLRSNIVEMNDNVGADEPQNAMDLYEDAIRCQSRRNALYRSKTAEDIKRSDRIKQRRREKETMLVTNETKLNETLNEANEAEWVNEVRNTSRLETNMNDADSGIGSKASSSVSSNSKKTLRALKEPKTKDSVAEKESKRSSKRVVIDDSSSSDFEKENIPANPSKRRSQEITPEKSVRSQDLKQSFHYCTNSAMSVVEDNNISAITNDNSFNSTDCSSDSESSVLSPVIGNKSKAVTIKPEIHNLSRLPFTAGLAAQISSADSNDKQTFDAFQEDDNLGLHFDSQPLCSTFIMNSTDSVTAIANRKIFQGIPPILPPVAIDVTIRYITNRTLETIFTANVAVKNMNETVQQILERSNFKEKFDLVPRLDVKFRGVRILIPPKMERFECWCTHRFLNTINGISPRVRSETTHDVLLRISAHFDSWKFSKLLSFGGT